MATVAENKAYWDTYDWQKGRGGEEWSGGWVTTSRLWYGTLMARVCNLLPTGHALEIACGQGRITEYLRRYSRKLTAIDLVAKNVDVCRERFAGDRSIELFVTDGLTLPMVDDASLDLAFSWDSLVHVEAEVMESYLRELGRKLKPGAYGFLHHSNLGAFVDANGQLPWVNAGWRGQSMTAAKARAFCKAAGLRCVSQELVPWFRADATDCFTVICRPREEDEGKGGGLPETVIMENQDFSRESKHFGKLARHYAVGPHAPTSPPPPEVVTVPAATGVVAAL